MNKLISATVHISIDAEEKDRGYYFSEETWAKKIRKEIRKIDLEITVNHILPKDIKIIEYEWETFDPELAKQTRDMK
jgi:hypothetical protein